jgi:hypothetical protein
MNIYSYFLIALVSCVQIMGSSAHINLLRNKKMEVKATKVKGRKNSLLNNLIKQNQEVKKLLSQRTEIPVIWEGNKKILTGKVFEGVLLNSIFSTNFKSPVLVKVNEGQSLPEGTEFSCTGVTNHSRVQVFCNKMILKEKEVRVAAQLLNRDGTSGLIGGSDDGEDDLMVGLVTSSIAEGAFAAAQDRVGGGLGSFKDNNMKNQVLGGLIEGGEGVSEVLLDKYKSKEPIVTVNAGAEVLIYFQEALHDY